MDQAHKDRKAEIEKQLKEGSTDPNLKTELEAINKLETEGNGETTDANKSDEVAAKAPATPKGGNAGRSNR